MKKLVIIAFLLLASCSTIPYSHPLPDGTPIAPASGWVQYCHDHNQDPLCKEEDLK